MPDDWMALYTDKERHKKVKKDAVEFDAEMVDVVAAALDQFHKLPKEQRQELIERARY